MILATGLFLSSEGFAKTAFTFAVKTLSFDDCNIARLLILGIPY
jgi:hypothetical protein